MPTSVIAIFWSNMPIYLPYLDIQVHNTCPSAPLTPLVYIETRIYMDESASYFRFHTSHYMDPMTTNWCHEKRMLGMNQK